MILMIWLIGTMYAAGVLVGLEDARPYAPEGRKFSAEFWVGLCTTLLLWPFYLGIHYGKKP